MPGRPSKASAGRGPGPLPREPPRLGCRPAHGGTRGPARRGRAGPGPPGGAAAPVPLERAAPKRRAAGRCRLTAAGRARGRGRRGRRLPGGTGTRRNPAGPRATSRGRRWSRAPRPALEPSPAAVPCSRHSPGAHPRPPPPPPQRGASADVLRSSEPRFGATHGPFEGTLLMLVSKN